MALGAVVAVDTADQARIEGNVVLGKGFPVATQAEVRHVELASLDLSDERDGLAAVIDEVLHDGPGRSDVVDGNMIVLEFDQVLTEEHERDVSDVLVQGRRSDADRAENEAVRLLARELVEDFDLTIFAAKGLCDQHRVSATFGLFYQKATDLGEVADIELGKDDADGSAAAGSQVLSGTVGLVAEGLYGLLDPLAHVSTDVWEVVDDVRHGASCDARKRRDIPLGHSHCLSSFFGSVYCKQCFHVVLQLMLPRGKFLFVPRGKLNDDHLVQPERAADNEVKGVILRITIRRRRVLLAAAAMTVASLALAGCSSSGGSQSSGGVTTITFWNGFTGPDGDALKARVAAFNKSQSSVKVDMTIMPWDVLGQKLLPALGAHKGPNISVSGAESVGQYASKGAFAGLGDYYSSWKDKGALFKADINATLYKGKHYSVPMTFSPVLTYYNKSLFKAAGLDPEKPPVTWEEFATDAKALTKDVDGDGKPEQYGFVLPDHTSPAMWETLMWGNGGGTVSNDGKKSTIQDAKSIDAVTYWSDLLKNDHISPAGISGPDADALFQSGKVGMLVEGPWMINGFTNAKLDFGVTDVPKGPVGAFPVANSNMLFISKDTMSDDKQKKAVGSFLDFWNSKANQVAWSVASGNPPTRQDISADEVKANPNMALFLPFQSKARFFLPGVTNFGDVNSSIYEASMQKITAGKGSPQEVMTSAGVQLQKMLDSAK